jgi:hypothetical protein
MGQAIFASERKPEKLNVGYENDKRLRWLFHPPTGVACTFDIHTKAVDPQSPWVRVRRRCVPRSAEEALDGMTLLEAMTRHPSTRPHTTGVLSRLSTYVVALQEMEDLPRWVRERIAILNMAEAGTRIPGIGKRWVVWDTAFNSLPMPDREVPSAYYTLEFACENEEGP